MHVCRQGYNNAGVFSIGCGEKVTPSWEAGKDLPHAGGVGLAGVDLFLYML